MMGRALCKTPTQIFGLEPTCKRCIHIMNISNTMTEDESQGDPPIGLREAFRIPSPSFGETSEGKVDKYKLIEVDRSKVYGDPFLSHQAIGLAWEGVFRNRRHELSMLLHERFPDTLGHLFTADLVAEMLAAFKVVRLARPIFHQDSVDDGIVYLKFSEKFRKK